MPCGTLGVRFCRLAWVDGALAAGQVPAECVGVAFSAERPHPAHLDKQSGDFILPVHSRVHSSPCTWMLLTSYFLQVDAKVEGPVLPTSDELVTHVVPTGNIILLQECMFLVTPNLFDQGKPTLVSGLALQAELESSTVVKSKAKCGEFTSTAEMCSRPRPAVVRVTFAVHFGYHTRYNIIDSGEVSRPSALRMPDCTAAKDVLVDTTEKVCLSSEDAATY